MEHILKSRYKIGEKLSENPFSVTYQGFLVGTEDPVVIKIYKRGTLNSVLIKNMRHKVRELASLNYPGLAKLLDGDYGWQGFYYVREYINGQTLAEILSREKRMKTEKAIGIAIEIGKALEITHKAGIVHGALSLNNIFVDREGMVKLADFIIEGEIKEALPMKVLALMESSSYSAPEELLGVPASIFSDIYSLGLILFEVLTGQKPFAQEKLAGALNRLENSPMFLREADASLPRYLEEIINRALEKEPRLRFPSISFLRESLENKVVIFPKLAAEDLVSIFESTVCRYGEEALPPEAESIEEVGRLKLKWSKEKHRTWLLAIIIALAVVSGLLYAFLFVR